MSWHDRLLGVLTLLAGCGGDSVKQKPAWWGPTEDALLAECATTPSYTGSKTDIALMRVTTCFRIPEEATCPEPADADLGKLTLSCTEGYPLCALTLTEQVEEPRDSGFHTGGPTPNVDACCYEIAFVQREQDWVCGRPLRDARGEARVASAAHRTDWRDAPVDTPPAVAAHWLREALDEHAAVGAFARLTLDLLALGAPADLVARAAEAMADEIAHARAAFALAGQAAGPGPLVAHPAPTPDLASLAAEAIADGVVNEAVAAAEAAVRRATATEPTVIAALDRVIRDEARHAALALDTARWAIGIGGPEVAAAARAALARGLARLDAAPRVEHVAPAWGLCPAAALRRARLAVRGALDVALGEVAAAA
jgi:hypothetical protein